MKVLQRLTVFLTAVLAACLFPIAVHAAEDHTDHTIDLNVSYVNPVYADVVTEDDLLPYSPSSRVTYSDPEYVTTVEEAGQILREQMKQRIDSAVVYIQTTEATEEYLTDLIYAISDQALIHTGVPVEGDYLKWQFAGWNANVSGSRNGDTYQLTYTYTITYYTTAEQEQTVDTAVGNLLSNLNVSSATDYEKVCAIYDYICENVTYDYEHVNDDSYKLQFTMYGALIDGTSVCQGYALLFYRLALELDVDSRLITGTGNGGAHGWNIVELNNLYYNVDSTWDAGSTNYSYFLKSDDNFANHTRYDEYASESFYAEYPMGEVDYIPDTPPEAPTSGTCGNNLTWNLKDDTLTISGTGAMTDFNIASRSSIPWESNMQDIRYVIIEEGVTTIGDYAFYNAEQLLEISVPDTVTDIGSYAFYNCSELSEISLSTKLFVIKDYAFYQCLTLTSMTFPETFKSLGTNSFATSGLKNITFECSAPSIGTNAFASVNANAYYPAADETWTASMRQNYGGNLTWIGTCLAGHVWDDGTITKEPTSTETGIMTYQCNICGETYDETLPVISDIETDVVRIYGSGRVETALEIADRLKEALNADKFEAIIIANGDNFADALAGSYLANVKDAPILLYSGYFGMSEENLEYIRNNLREGGVVYLLGGTSALPESAENALADYKVERLAGATRFETNLLILEEAGINDEEILIATGMNFADSLSASATGLPILLVNSTTGTLTEEQITFLKKHESNAFTILGGPAAINSELESIIEEIVGKDIARVSGQMREETSVKIAEKYFNESEFVVLAYSLNFPDGLCGGPLAYAMNAPLLMTNTGKEQFAADYVAENDITAGYVLGGTVAVSDDTVKHVFNLNSDTSTVNQ